MSRRFVSSSQCWLLRFVTSPLTAAVFTICWATAGTDAMAAESRAKEAAWLTGMSTHAISPDGFLAVSYSVAAVAGPRRDKGALFARVMSSRGDEWNISAEFSSAIVDPDAGYAELTGKAVLTAEDSAPQSLPVIAAFTETTVCLELVASEPLRFEGDLLDGRNVFGGGSPKTFGVLLLTRPEAVIAGAWVTWRGDDDPADGGVVGEIRRNDGSYQVIDNLVTVAAVKRRVRSTVVHLEGPSLVSTGGETCQGWLRTDAALELTGGGSLVVADPGCDVDYSHAQATGDDDDDGDLLKLTTATSGTGLLKG